MNTKSKKLWPLLHISNVHVNMDINLDIRNVIKVWNNLRAQCSFYYHVIYHSYQTQLVQIDELSHLFILD